MYNEDGDDEFHSDNDFIKDEVLIKKGNLIKNVMSFF